jgi:hypothetical protein
MLQLAGFCGQDFPHSAVNAVIGLMPKSEAD